jgi:hypothetical protein
MTARYSSRVLGVSMVGAVLLSACTSMSSPDPESGGASRESASPVTTSVPPGPASFERPASAIYRRFHDSFPEPLIELDELVTPGPAPDDIAPIDDPRWLTVDEVAFLQPQDSVMVVDVAGDARAFPAQIMIWHEIANVEIGGIPLSVTYCPLCNSATAFERTHPDGTVMDFGTSGLLYNSALVMYDRQTASLWTHFDGRAVHGVLTGNELVRVPVATVSFVEFATAHPDGLVLGPDRRNPRSYGQNPYPEYDSGGNGTLYPVDFDDSVAPALTRVVAIRDRESVAVAQELLAAERVIELTVDDRELVVWLLEGTASALDESQVSFGRDVGATGVFVSRLDGRPLSFEPTDTGFRDRETGSEWNVLGRAVAGELEGAVLEPVEHLDTFWFAIAAHRPDTRLITATPQRSS